MHAFFYLGAIFIVAQGSPNLRDRERHPLAPSLPLLTKEESAQIERVIDRFILYDIGKLKGAEGKKALDDFHRLGPEATFELIDGLNRTADLEASCPVVIIAKKLSSLFLSTDDTELLTFARENMGAGVTAKRHLGVVHDLHTLCLLRRATVLRRVAAQGGRKSVTVMSIAELEKSASKESGANLKAVLTELQRRAGVKPIELLARGTLHADTQIAEFSKQMLAKSVQRQTPEMLRGLLKHSRPEVQLAAVESASVRKLLVGAELISLLQTGGTDVSQAARRALVQLSGGVDHGPSPGASFGEREEAAARWRAWWSKQESKK